MDNEVLPFQHYSHLIEEKDKKSNKDKKNPYEIQKKFLTPNIKKLESKDFFKAETGQKFSTKQILYCKAKD